jgi:hypothetical protein
MDYAELMDLSKTMDASAMLETMLQSADLSDKDTAYATVAGLVDPPPSCSPTRASRRTAATTPPPTPMPRTAPT